MLTPTEEAFLEDLRHIEKQFGEATSDADKQYYADQAMSIWRAIGVIYVEKGKRYQECLDKMPTP